MRVTQCNRCKKILTQKKFFSYNFDAYDGESFWNKDILQGDLCFSCYKEFEKFLCQETN